MKILSGALVVTLFLAMASTVVFAARLPTVGGDNNAWGTFLNEYLQAEHGVNGAHTNITSENINVSNQICLGADCRSVWPAPGVAVAGWTISGNYVYNDTALIGIGIATPGMKLHVVGSANITGSTFTKDVNVTSQICLGGVCRTTWPATSGIEDNTTLTNLINTKANQSDLFNNATRLELIAGRQTSDNTTLTNTKLSVSSWNSENTTIGATYATLSRLNADNTTILNALNMKVNLSQLSGYMTISDNTTLTALIGTKVNLTQLSGYMTTNDNTTLSNRLTTLETDNTTQSNAITTITSRQSADNTTIANNLTTTSARIGSLETKQSADNTTLSNRFSGLLTTSDNTTILNALNTKFNITNWNSENTTIGNTYATISRVNSDNTTILNALNTKANFSQLSGYMTTSDNTTLTDLINTKANQSDLFNNASRIETIAGRESADNTTILNALNTKANLSQISGFLTTSDNTTILNALNTKFNTSNWNSENTTIQNTYATLARVNADNTTLAALIGTKINLSNTSVECAANNYLYNVTVDNGRVMGLCRIDVSGGSAGGGWTNDSATTSTSYNIDVGTGKLFVNSTSGNVGIGTANPSTNLQVQGNVSVYNDTLIKGHVTLGRGGTFDAPPGTLAVVNIQENTSVIPANTWMVGIENTQLYNVTTNNDHQLIGIESYTYTDPTSTTNMTGNTYLTGIKGTAAHYGQGNYGIIRGSYISAMTYYGRSTSTTGLFTTNGVYEGHTNTLAGIDAQISIGDTLAMSTANNAYVFKSNDNNFYGPMSLDNLYGIYMQPITSNSGNINRSYAIYLARPQSSGTLNSSYGLYIQNYSGIANTTNYAIYVIDGVTYLGGKVGIGTISPGMKLEVNGSSNMTGTLYVEGVNVTGRQSADNTTLGNKIATLQADNTTQSNLIATLQADNTTQANLINTKANQSDLFNNASRIEAIAGRESADNTTQAALLGQKLNLTGGNVSGAVNLATSSGYVGVGTMSPTQKLHVNGSANITGNVSMPDSFWIGQNAGIDGEGSVSIGTEAGRYANGSYNAYFGYHAGKSALGGSGVYMGNSAGERANGSYNIYIGYVAGQYVGDGAVGATSNYNVHIGTAAGTYSNGDFNVYTGYNTGQNAMGSENIYTGNYAGIMSVGHNNTYTGNYAGFFANANGTIGIGHESLSYNTANNVIAIGYRAGYANNDSDQFIIKQENVNPIPLIQGNFSSGFVGIGTTNPTSKLDVSGTLTVEGVNVTGRQTSDNTTILNALNTKVNLSQLSGYMTTSDNTTLTSLIGTKVNLTQLSGYMTTNDNTTLSNRLTTLETDNTTLTNSINMKANQSDLFNNATRIETIAGRQSADNTTLTNNLTTTNTRIGTLETKQSADNTTISNRISGFLTTSDNTTLRNYIDTQDGTKLNLTTNNLGATLSILGTDVTNNLTLNVNNTFYVNGSTGNVGINTTNPTSSLHVVGNIRLSGSLLINTNEVISTGGYLFGTYGDAGNPAHSFFDDKDTGMYRPAVNSLAFTVGGNESVRIDSTGNLGIGTVQLLGKFHVNGSIYQNGAYNPTIKGSISDVRLNSAVSVYVSGKYAYVAASNNDSLTIVDISNPAAPVITGSITDVRLNGSSDVYVSGKYAYVTTYFNDSFSIIDISDPAAPVIIGLISDVRLDSSNGVYVSGKYAYVTAANNDSLSIIDISNPAAPVITGYITDARLDFANGIYVSGKYAYVAAAGNDSLTIVDISNPAAPVITGSVSDVRIDSPYGIYVQGKYAYVASRNNDSFSIIDISNSTSPIITGYITDVRLDLAVGVYVSGKYAYVAAPNNDSLTIIDISDPAAPVIIGSITDVRLDFAYGIYVQGKYAYVASSINNSLSIIDISGIDAPVASIGAIETGSLSVTENARVANGLYVGSGLNVGPNGIYSQGPVSIYSNATTALYINGTLNVTNAICLGPDCRTTWPGSGDNTTLTNLINTKANQSDLFNNGSRIENLYAKQSADNATLTAAIGTKLNLTGGNISGAINLATSGGFVGIGTENPSIDLNVANSRNGSAGIVVYNINNGSEAASSVEVQTDVDLFMRAYGIMQPLEVRGMVELASDDAWNSFRIRAGADIPMIFMTYNAERMRISLGNVTIGNSLYVLGSNNIDNLTLNVNNTLYVNASSDRVGIGTTTPSSKLDVSGTLTVEGINVTGRQSSDNTTISNRISGFLTTSDNTTILNALNTKVNLSQLSGYMTTSDNTTLTNSINTKAGTGDCGTGNVVQNTTTGGVQCIPFSSAGDNAGADNATLTAAIGTKLNLTTNTLSATLSILGTDITNNLTLNVSGILLVNDSDKSVRIGYGGNNESLYIKNDGTGSDAGIDMFVNGSSIGWSRFKISARDGTSASPGDVGSITIRGGNGIADGGEIVLKGGYGIGNGSDAGYAYLQGGDANGTASIPGDVWIKGGSVSGCGGFSCTVGNIYMTGGTNDDTSMYGAIIMQQDNVGVVGIGASDQNYKLTTNSLLIVNKNSYGISLNAYNILYVNGSSGSVGIGTANPSQKLDVAGNVNAFAYQTNGTDYAEVLAKLDASETIVAGDVVGVFGGKITKKITGADSILVVTNSAGVLGNSGVKGGVSVAFMGQVKINVNGKVDRGDYIVADDSGVGKAVKPSVITSFVEYKKVIGTAWEAKSSTGLGKVLVAVGVK